MGVLVSVLSFYAVAQSVGNANKFSSTPGNPSCRFFDGFADNGNGTVTDPRNGIVWKLCPGDQKWDLTMNKCIGNPEYMTWFEAVNQTAKYKDTFWRIPTIKEATSIIGSFEDGCKENNSTKKSLSTFVLKSDGTVQAISDKFIQKTNGYGFLPEFWTLSTCQENEAFACVVSGKSGEIQNDVKRNERRFVYLISNGEKEGDIAYFEQAKKFSKYIVAGKIETQRQHTELNKRSQEYLKKIEIERREAAERESRERDRVVNACNNFYQGKSIGFKPAGWSYFGSVLDAVVLGKGNGNVSIKIVDRHFTDLYGKTLEMSCTSDQLQ